MKRALQQTTKMGPREKVKDVKSSTASDSTTLPGETGQRKEIDPKGDVLLVLGAKSNEKTEILVSSKVLSLNSSVFSAMFSNSLSEGTALIQNSASNQPTRIPLPGDNCDAIILLCEILHFRYDHAKQGVPELAALLDLGIVVHKYDCSRALAFIGEKWMEKYLPSAGLNGFEDVLLIAYLFDDSKMFKAVSKKVVINHVGSFREAYAGCFNGIEEKLPVATFGNSQPTFSLIDADPIRLFGRTARNPATCISQHTSEYDRPSTCRSASQSTGQSRSRLPDDSRENLGGSPGDNARRDCCIVLRINSRRLQKAIHGPGRQTS